MTLQDLTKEQAVALLSRISYNLQQSEDARDFCLWLADVLNEEADLNIDLTKSC